MNEMYRQEADVTWNLRAVWWYFCGGDDRWESEGGRDSWAKPRESYQKVQGDLTPKDGFGPFRHGAGGQVVIRRPACLSSTSASQWDMHKQLPRWVVDLTKPTFLCSRPVQRHQVFCQLHEIIHWNFGKNGKRLQTCHHNTWSKEQTWFPWMDLIVVVIQVGELGVSWICSWIVTIIVHAPKNCESICGCKLHYLCHVINMSFIISLMFIMTVVFCRRNGHHLWSHRWRRCGQLGAFSSGFSGVPGEILGSLVWNKIE